MNEELKKEIQEYNEALEIYYSKKFQEAVKLFDELERNYNSKIYTTFKNRAISYLNSNEIFTEVYTHKEK